MRSKLEHEINWKPCGFDNIKRIVFLQIFQFILDNGDVWQDSLYNTLINEFKTKNLIENVIMLSTWHVSLMNYKLGD